MYVRGADARALLSTEVGSLFIPCERIGYQRTAVIQPVTSTEGKPGNPDKPDEQGVEANISDIVGLRITLVMPSLDPVNNLWSALTLDPGDFCDIQLQITDQRGNLMQTGVMGFVYESDAFDAAVPGKIPATMSFRGDGVSLEDMRFSPA